MLRLESYWHGEGDIGNVSFIYARWGVGLPIVVAPACISLLSEANNNNPIGLPPDRATYVRLLSHLTQTTVAIQYVPNATKLSRKLFF